MKTEIRVFKTTQQAIPEMKREEKTLYFLLIGSEEGVVTINVGEKTYNSIKKIIENENNSIKKLTENENNNNPIDIGDKTPEMDKIKKAGK